MVNHLKKINDNIYRTGENINFASGKMIPLIIHRERLMWLPLQATIGTNAQDKRSCNNYMFHFDSLHFLHTVRSIIPVKGECDWKKRNVEQSAFSALSEKQRNKQHNTWLMISLFPNECYYKLIVSFYQ